LGSVRMPAPWPVDDLTGCARRFLHSTSLRLRLAATRLGRKTHSALVY
jgi:hypothetical protein